MLLSSREALINSR